MDTRLINDSVQDFTTQLASRAPIPGGGGAAALCGALAAALCAMAGNLTVGKKKYAAFEADQQRMIARSEELHERFLALIEAVAAAFEPLSKAYSLPKDAPGYAETMTRVTLDACRAPYEMLECCGDVITLLEEMLEKCSRLMISDVGCGAIMATAAAQAAYLNVIINTGMLPDDEQAQRIAADSEEMLKHALPRAKKIADLVTDTLRRNSNG